MSGIDWGKTGISEEILNRTPKGANMTVREAIEGLRNEIIHASRDRREEMASHNEIAAGLVKIINSDEDTLFEIARSSGEQRAEIAKRSPRTAELVVTAYQIEAERRAAKENG